MHDRPIEALFNLRVLAKTPGVRLLLAGADEIVMEVATTMLRQAGYLCDVVNNGPSVVQEACTGKFDLVLIDCQIQEMDAYAASRAIRRAEAEAGTDAIRSRVPIIALTASVHQGDRERCLAAGMDGLISMPLRPERLIEIIESKLTLESTPDSRIHEGLPFTGVPSSANTISKTRHDPGAPLNLDASLQRWSHDCDLVVRLLNKFRTQAVMDLEKLEQCVVARNAVEVERLSHTIKGAAAYVDGEKLRELAADLEAMARAADFGCIDIGLAQLKDEINRCLNYVPEALTFVAEVATGRKPRGR